MTKAHGCIRLWLHMRGAGEAVSRVVAETLFSAIPLYVTMSVATVGGLQRGSMVILKRGSISVRPRG